MAYVRKTRDAFELWVNYGATHGWEHELTEYTVKDIKERRKEYRENCPQFPCKMIKRRERIEGATA